MHLQAPPLEKVRVIDSHTGGEPTRVVVEGGPDLGTGPLRDRRELFRTEYDAFRRGVVCEPHGSDAVVGALIVEPHDRTCEFGVIFFNNVGYLGMCVHATIGVAVTLAQLGQLVDGVHRVDTPVGVVTTEVLPDGRVRVRNVASYLSQANVRFALGGDAVTGSVAWGGNWFFLADSSPVEIRPENVRQLTGFTWAVRERLAELNITGDDGSEVDHVEVFGPPSDPLVADGRNFVLCPGGAYDRSPCGTGTSAKVACLAAEGKLAPGQIWRQESVIGSVFEGSYEPSPEPGRVIPSITGSAFVTAEATLLFDPRDPFRDGTPI